MKKCLVLLLVLAATLMMASCTKEKNYYVKYEASANAMYSGMSVKVNTEKGEQSYYVSGKTFSETFGPVSKGFYAKISAQSNSGSTNTSIYVCRGEDPFVLKAKGSSKAEYTIDF